MEKSENIKELATALAAFQSELPVIDLDRTVQVKSDKGSYSFKYATFKNVVEATKPLLAKNGLSFSQLIQPDGSVTTILMHSSGQWISSTLMIKGGSTPQSIGSGISYAKRYSLASILGVVAEDDDDANIAEGNTFTTADTGDTRKWLNKGTKDYENAVHKLASGAIQMDGIEKHYKISKSTRESLLSDANSQLS